MFCPKCGKSVPEGSTVCMCGYSFVPAAPQPEPIKVDTSWKKEYKSKGKHIAGVIIGCVILATLFPFNLLTAVGGTISSSSDSQSNQTLTIVFWVLTALSLIGGLLLVILSAVSLSKAKKHNAEITKKHQADIEAERKQKELQNRMRQQQQELQRQKPQNQTIPNGFNAGTTGKMLFQLEGTISTLQVYEDRVLHIAKTTARSYVAGKFFNGTKEYFYEDLTNIQFRETTKRFNGYLQFDYPGAVNISASGFGGAGGNYNSENSFIFDTTITNGLAVMPGEDKIRAANRIASDAYRYIHGRIVEEKKAKKNGGIAPQIPSASKADELKKYNELLQSGAITQEEYDSIKSRLI